MGQSIQELTKQNCGRQPLNNLRGYGLRKADHTASNVLKAVVQGFYLVHSWVFCRGCVTKHCDMVFSRFLLLIGYLHFVITI